ncbi:MAG: hypothetical protein ACKVP5_21815 [Aestuariivirga sp.]
MSRHFLFATFFCFFVLQPRILLASEEIELSAPNDIALVRPLSAAIDAVGKAVTECLKAGGDPQQCQCDNLDSIALFNKETAKLLAERPQWKDAMLLVRNFGSGGESLSLSMAGVIKQSQHDYSYCPK